MVTTFTHRLSPPRIIFSTLFFTALDIFSFDEAAVQKVFTWWKPERDGQEENKLCFGRCWEKLPKVALIHPIHPRAVHAIYAVHTDKHKCLPQMHRRAPSLTDEDLRWGSVCVLRRICGEELRSFVISPLMLGGQLLTRAAREKRWKKCFNKFPSISTGVIFQGR